MELQLESDRGKQDLGLQPIERQDLGSRQLEQMHIHKKFGNNRDNRNPIHAWNCSGGAEANKSWDLD